MISLVADFCYFVRFFWIINCNIYLILILIFFFSKKKIVFVFFKQRFANFVKLKNKVLGFFAFQISEIALVLMFPKHI